MNVSILPSVIHVSPLTNIRRERRLPVPGTVTARVNERVQAQDVVAEAEPARRRIFIDVARGLGVSEAQAERHVRKQAGDRVDAGDVIAGPVGMARRTLRAPAGGRIVRVSEGRVLLEALGQPIQLRAGFPGLVVSSDGVQSVTIEAAGALVQGVWGNGKQEFGVMHIAVEGPGEPLREEMLDIDTRGAILVAGICSDHEPLSFAAEMRLRGLILGGLDSELIPVANRLPYPILVLEGFGERPISGPAYEVLVSSTGREVMLDARPIRSYDDHRPEVIIPLVAGRRLEPPPEVVPLAIGVRVHLLRPPHEGAVGLIKQLPSQATTFPSGVMARCATVDIEGVGEASIPLANLEIIP
jgi:hypothetical protein